MSPHAPHGTGGGSIGPALQSSAPVAGFTYSDGDGFDTALSVAGPGALNGDYFPSRGGYLIKATGQRPRGSGGLSGIDVDPRWTGHLDSNWGAPIASLADISAV